MIRKELKIFVSQLHWRQSLKSQVGPALHEVGQIHKGIQSQSVISIVGQMGHENADLKKANEFQCKHIILTLGGSAIIAMLVFLKSLHRV